MKRLWRILNQVNGFSLIEAIITIAIVGIIVVPISMVFTGSLRHATEARELLKVTQLAQLYIENIKAKSDVELMDFFISTPTDVIGERTLEPDDVDISGFPIIPEGYKARLMFDKGDASLSSYSNPTQVAVEIDGVITLYPDPPGMKSREITIDYDNDHTYASIENKITSNDDVITTSTQTITNEDYAIKINCGNSDLDTTITVNNETPTTVKLYIYTNPLSTMDLEVDGINYMKIDNLQEGSTATDKIYAVTVQIIEDNEVGNDDDDEVVAEVSATKIDE